MKSTNNAAEPELRGLFSTWAGCSCPSTVSLSSAPTQLWGSLELCRALQHRADTEGGQDGASSLL